MRTVLAGVLAGVLALAGCAEEESGGRRPGGDGGGGGRPAGADPLRLTAGAGPGPRPPVTPGTTTLPLPTGAEGLVRVPRGYDPARPAPLVLLLHGAGATGRAGLALLEDEADGAGALLVALSSQGRTWDAVLGQPGGDVEGVDALLREAFERFSVDPDLVAVGGFSDGASYALGLGLANGGLFRHVLAFSPGFVAGDGREGRPRVFVSHGTLDRVLPVERCGRAIARRAETAGYDVTYLEFPGGHEVPTDVRRAAVEWWLGPRR